MRLHFKLKSPVKIVSDSAELMLTICAIMEHYEKTFNKHLKNASSGTRTTGQMLTDNGCLSFTHSCR